MTGLFAPFSEQRARQRFERMTEQALPSLYRAARRLTACQADAEDLVHDTCLKAFEAWQRMELRNVEAHRAWLLRILINAFRDQYRRRQRAPEIELVAPDNEPVTGLIERAPSSDPGPERHSEHKEFIRTVDAGIRALSPEVRLVVTLFFIEDLSYREIAEIADCPIGTVMSRLSRGRHALRVSLAAHAPARMQPTPKTRQRSAR